jgi:hypothetical protein
MTWNATLPPPGLPRDIVAQDQIFYDDHVNKTGVKATKGPRTERGKQGAVPTGNWVARNARTEVKGGVLHVTADGKQRPFIAFTNLSIPGPATVIASVRSEQGGKLGIEWRLNGQPDFSAAQSTHQELPASAEFQAISIPVPAAGTLIHLRLVLPAGTSDLRRFELKSNSGKQSRQWSFDTPPPPAP